MLDKISENRIDPHRVTRPIQLLAAWMVGLVITNSSFLIASIQMDANSWEKGALVVASICNVPIFLFAFFLLQTRFRAELQEDTFYSEYLSKKTSTTILVDKNLDTKTRLERMENQSSQHPISTGITSTNCESIDEVDWEGWAVALNVLHPRFKEIRMSLRESKIPLKTFFGNKEDLPKNWVVSVSNFLPFENKIAILRAIYKYGFDGFVFWDPIREAEETEDVYIGSYGTTRFAPFNEDFNELIENDNEEVDLAYFYQQSMSRTRRVRRKVITSKNEEQADGN